MTAAGTTSRRLAVLSQPAGTWLRWSPDGRFLAFAAPVGGQFDIHVLRVSDDAVTVRRDADTDERAPAWSADGRWLYFGSNRDGRWQIWRAPAGGGAAERVTPNGGLAAIESHDGRWLYYVKADEPGLWRRKTAGDSEAEEQVTAAFRPGVLAWDLSAGAAYYARPGVPGAAAALMRLPIDGGREERVAWLEPPTGGYPEWHGASGLSVSADGRSVTVATIDRSDSDLWLVPGTASATASNPPRPAALAPSNARWASDGQAVVFHAKTEGRTHVYLQRVGSTKIRQLTSGDADDYGPDFSPDGASLVFYSGNERNFEINVMRIDGSERRRLTNTGAYEGNPHFSPDGSRIAFSSNRDGNHEIYVMAADGSNPRRLARHDANDWTPRFSPRGDRLAFVSDRGGDFSVYTMNLDGGDVRLVADRHAHDYYPDWSPDGRRLAFFSGPDYEHFQVYVVDIESGATQVVTAAPTTASHPAWSPDGQRLLIGAGASEVLMLVRPDGSERRPLGRSMPPP